MAFKILPPKKYKERRRDTHTQTALVSLLPPPQRMKQTTKTTGTNSNNKQLCFPDLFLFVYRTTNKNKKGEERQLQWCAYLFLYVTNMPGCGFPLFCLLCMNPQGAGEKKTPQPQSAEAGALWAGPAAPRGASGALFELLAVSEAALEDRVEWMGVDGWHGLGGWRGSLGV